MQKESFILKACDFVTKYSIWALIFLMPIFFLPWTSDVLEFNKQFILLFLVFLSVFAFMLKTLVSGKLEIKKSPINIIVGLLFLAYALATVFSSYRNGSFWGQTQQISESLITAMSLILFYFLISNFFSERNITISAIILSVSGMLAQLFGIFQLFGLFMMPFDFAKNISFNTIGLPGSLGLFAAILLPIEIVLLIMAKKWWKLLFIFEIAVSALILVLVNYSMIWWVVIIGSALILILGTIKRNLFDGRWMALPMFFLAISLFFVLLGLQINWLPQRTTEVFLSQKSGLNIAWQTIKQKPIFGSGLGTFAYDFSKFKNPEFSNTSLWNVTFNKSSSKILNNLATMGVVGFLAILSFIFMPIFYGIKSLIAEKESAGSSVSEKTASQNNSILLLGLSVALITESIIFFIYDSNLVLDFVFFFITASLIGIVFKNKKKYILKPSSFLTLTITFACTLFFIFGMGLLILDGQRYVAETEYYSGLVSYQSGQNEEGLKKIESAASLNPQSDVYFRQLSQAYLLSLQNKLQSAPANPTAEEKESYQALVSNAINAGKIATDINPEDVNNWALRGYVYQNLLNISNEAQDWAISSYDSALKLDPNNPYLFYQQGSVYLSQALNLMADSTTKRSELLEKAKNQLEKAVSLNPNYSDAQYSLGIVYDSLGQKDKAIKVFEIIQQLNPTNTEVKAVLENLRAGKPILQTAPTTTDSDKDSSKK